MKAELTKRCLDLVNIAGCGPDLVAELASQVDHETMIQPDGTGWNPSERWAYWFVGAHLGLVPRRITSRDAASPEQIEQQARLHELNVEFIAIALQEGLHPKFIMGSDEFGMFLFPSGNVIWAKQGAKHVTSDLAENKRQYTGDIVHNAAGGIVCAVQIFAGRTDASLPLPAVQALYPNIHCDKSDNHWANLDTKKRLLARVWRWVCREWVADGLEGDPKCIYFLDCWPVNLTQALRDWVTECCPGMRLRFIPAGATGKYQVNDTHLHKPLKDAARAAAQRWRLGKVMAFRRACASAIASGTDESVAKAELHQKVHDLMGMKMLRSVAPQFLWVGCERLLEEHEGRNIIKKGWDQLYLDMATAPGFADKARENREQRRLAATAAASFAAGVAAAAAAAGSSGSVASVPSVTQALLAATDADNEENTLVAAVAEYERQWHELDVATAPETGKKRRAGKAAERAAKRVTIDTAAGTETAAPESPAAAADADVAADLPVVTEEDLANLSNKQLQDMCKIRGVAIYGAKPALIKRLTDWRPGTKRSSRGRKGAGAAAGDAVPMADAGEASDDEEEIAEERYMDPCAEEDEPYDPAADAAALAAAQELHAGYYM